jgi:hypothetical protein
MVKLNPWGQCYKTFHHGNLPPFHGNSIILCYKDMLPCNYHRIAVIYGSILTTENVGLELPW